MAEISNTIKESSLLPLEFQNGVNKNLTNPTLQNFLKELAATDHENDIKKIIEEIVHCYVTSTENKLLHIEVRNTIIELFTKFNGKKHLKKYVQDLVIKQNLVNDIIKSTAEDILDRIKNEKTCDLKECHKFLHFVSVLQTSPKYDFETNCRPLFPLYIFLFDSYGYYASQVKQDIIPEIEELNFLMSTVVKQILPVFVKNISFLEEIKEQYLQSLLMYCYILLFNEKIGFDLRLKVCLVFVYSFNVLEGDTMSISQLLSKNQSLFNLSINEASDEEKPSDYLIIIYSSIISVLSEEKLVSETVDGKSLILVLFEGILETYKSNPGHSSIVIETSKTLCLMAKQFRKIPLNLVKDIFLEGLYYVSSHADYFIDTVRNYSKIFFEELVALAAYHYGNGSTELTDILVGKFEEIPDEGAMRFFAYENIAKYYGCDFLLKEFDQLPLILLECVDNPTIIDQACKSYQMLLEKSFSTDNEEVWIKTWVIPVINLLRSGQRNENFCQKIISAAFKLQPALLRMTFPNDYIGTVEESKVLLHCLLNARKNGIELSLEKDSILYWRGLIDKQKMEMFMIHQDEEIRLLVLASITESLKSTELYLDWEFIFLINYIRYNITAQSPNVRKQIVCYYKKVLTRFDAGYKVIGKNISNLSKSLELNSSEERDQKKYLSLYQELKKSYRRFICNLTRIFIGNLSYDSNYPRRATSLELLLIIQTILNPDEWKSCWNEEDVKNSHNILFDSYESNKGMIVKLLKTLPPNYLGFMNVNFTFKYMQRSFELATDVKPSKTLSAAYLFDICSYSPFFFDIVHSECGEAAKKGNDPTLDMIVVLTRKLINQTADIKIDHVSMANASVYGLILSVRHLLENRDISKHNDTYSGVFGHLVGNCINISSKIMPVVCNPSPEGYLPDYVEDFCENDESPKAQMVLVYAWRTMKEMTLLLAEIVKQTMKLESEISMLSDDLLMEVGQLFVNVFVQSKHRGVFEQASVGFSIICEHYWSSSREKINSLPRQWLNDALELCTGKKHSEDLCPTRRSAGLPFLILSIVTTSIESAPFQTVMSCLLKTAEDSEDGNSEIKMHCLNVLRAIFRHSKLGELVAPYVAAGVILAIKGFRSETWGIRNSSTLLFAALMVRMFGVQRTADDDRVCFKNKLTVRVFFLRYEPLYSFILSTLAEECHNKSSLVLQPILMVLSRLYPSNFEEESCQVKEYLPYINVCLSSPDYRTRDAAAKASVALINNADIKSHFEMCFNKIGDINTVTDNECHGIVLQMCYILKYNIVRDLPLASYLTQSLHIWELAGKKFSHMTVNLYTELITLLLQICSNFDDVPLLKNILLHLSKQGKTSDVPLTWQENFLSTRTVLAYYIINNKFEETETTYSTVTNEIMSYMYGHENSMKRFFLELLIKLNQIHLYHNQSDNAIINSEAEIDNHPLFYTGDVEIRPSITTLVTSFSRTSVENILKHIHPYLKTFLIEELKIQHNICSEDRVLFFLLLDFYPCAIKFLRLSKQETLNALLSYCDCDNEELISAVISCISTFLMEVDYTLLKYDKLLEVLAKSASPAAAVHRRLTVCDFLCKNSALYCNEEPVLKGDELCTVINIVMVLLEDEDLDVRNAMSNYENALKVKIKINNFLNQTISGHRWPVVPEKAKEDLIHLMTVLLPRRKAVCLIFSWACRYFPDPSCEPSEIFERGGLNQYAENTPLIDICSRVLIKMLWTLPEGLSYDDKSIFPEEQTQIVTSILLDSLMKYDSPMMLTKTKMSVICVLKSMYKFLENAEISSNFVNNFKTYLNDTSLSYLTNHLEHGDLFCVKKIIRKLYDPVFRLRR
ncbi:thyroid adenoma-associated protein homolog isoform X2 [Sitophilus oryzae]|uniref:tRNA (32-2'-O)-methyltransferase regulator THADA n=1 Tax=Sitophilus oryzae TaxID=7048 RepID=A0A6J2YKP6_SITOR|nr:thyroid adenoma-associated protein homolog isoform X2 [Sitophilus oryzae]